VSGEDGSGTSSVAMAETTFSPLTSLYPNFSTDEHGLNNTSNALHIPNLDPPLEDIPILARK
jgi:hypothetical protein